MICKTPKDQRKPGTWGFVIYIGIIVLVALLCVALHSVILLSRYFLIINGALIFSIAYFMAKDTKNGEQL